MFDGESIIQGWAGMGNKLLLGWIGEIWIGEGTGWGG